MRKYMVAILLGLLCVFTALPASAIPIDVAADNFSRPAPAQTEWRISENTLGATNYAWAGDVATDPDAATMTGLGVLLCESCVAGRTFSGTLGPSTSGGSASAVFENTYADQQISVAENATTDLSTAYLARVNFSNGMLEIVRRVSGSETILASTWLPPFRKTWLTVSLTVSGASLSASAQYNGGLLVSVSTTDGSPLGAGSAGIYVNFATARHFDEVMFDSFVATI